MRHTSTWVIVMSFLFSHACSQGPEVRFLAVGGTHIFEEQAPCKLIHAEPHSAVKDLAWKDALGLEALHEGTAEIACGNEKIRLEIVIPVRLDIDMAVGEPIELQKPFKVRARLYDRGGRELEGGKFTVFDWTCSPELETANDRSGGEFGLCDTCYGMQTFRAVKPGAGRIEVRLGNLRGTRTVSL